MVVVAVVVVAVVVVVVVVVIEWAAIGGDRSARGLEIWLFWGKKEAGSWNRPAARKSAGAGISISANLKIRTMRLLPPPLEPDDEREHTDRLSTCLRGDRGGTP